MKDSYNLTISKKAIKITIAVLMALIVISIAIAVPLGILFSPRIGEESDILWDSSKQIDLAKDVITLEKEQDKEFKILNLADIQLANSNDIFTVNRVYDTVKKVVDKETPDLITLTGDNIWLDGTKFSAKRLIKEMDSLGIPWAPVFGNHDDENDCDKNWLADQFLAAENSIFSKGPWNISGVGNYIINIKEKGTNKIVQTLFMMDSHAGASYPSIDVNEVPDEQFSTFNSIGFNFDIVTEKDKKGNSVEKKVQVGTNYDYIKQDQIDWYKWAVEGIQAQNNGTVVPSTCFFHIPLPEFYQAYKAYNKETPTDKSKGDTVENSAGNFGENNENVCAPKYNSGFFAMMKDLGSTKNVIVGHDHVNNASIMYEGIRLTYANKTGNGCYWKNDGSMNGGTSLTIDSAGNATTRHSYVKF